MSDMLLRSVTKSAFSAARKKLKETAFIELNAYFVSLYYQKFQPRRWRGFDLRAIDGSTVRLPNTPDVIKKFGQEQPPNGRPYVLGRISHVFDPLNRLIVDAIIAPYQEDERSLALKHLPALQPGNLVLFDAGYPAFWLFAALRARQIDWCARASLETWSAVKQFAASGEAEKIVSLAPWHEAIRECQKLGLSSNPIRVRLIRVPLADGEVEVLITSLLDVQAYLPADFAALYFLRWGQEESYKLLKCRVELANWTGKSALSVCQDFHARILSTNLTMSLAMSAQDTLDRQHTDERKPSRINKTYAVSAMKDTVVRLLTSADPRTLLRWIIDKLARVVEVVRPGRSYPRKKEIKPRAFYTSYKGCK